jgi:hypothetical protein
MADSYAVARTETPSQPCVRAQGEPPAAPALFRELGADPALAVLEVEVEHVTPSDEAKGRGRPSGNGMSTTQTR